MDRRQTAPITCSDLADLLPAIADGQIDADEAPDIFDHLAGCSACQEELALHDLCSLAIAGEREPAKEAPKVVQFHLPRWLSLPVAAAAGLAIVVLLRSAGGDTATDQTAQAVAERRDQVEILQVLEPDARHPHQRFLVRIGGPDGDTRWVDQSQLDDAMRQHGGSRPVQVPVGFQR